MKRVGVADLKNQLSKHLRAVESGAEVEVTDRDRPIARIVPIGVGRQITVRPARDAFDSIRGRTYPPAGWATGSTDLLLEERQDR
ncbi:MAG: type II toxin-antitoxin system prevent-host-death family antitoxin [Candidatus Limnocylindrales bacterium]